MVSKSDKPTQNIFPATHVVKHTDGYDTDCIDEYYGPCSSILNLDDDTDIAVEQLDGSTLVYSGVPAGVYLDHQVRQILDSGTTSTGVYVMFNHGRWHG
jgi:hypothetical protein